MLIHVFLYACLSLCTPFLHNAAPLHFYACQPLPLQHVTVQRHYVAEPSLSVASLSQASPLLSRAKLRHTFAVADKLRHIPYSYDNAFQDYAYTCLDYLLELGLIYEIKSEGHIYYAVSAKGNAYKRYKASHYLKELFPYIVAVLSLITNVIIAIKTN